MENEKFIKDYVKKRDNAIVEALMHENYKPLIELCKQNTGKIPTNHKVLEITARKMAVHCTSIDGRLRLKAIMWLLSHGCDLEI